MRNGRSAIGVRAAALVFAGAASTGATQALAYSKRVEQACHADYKNLCPQYRPNSTQLRACMESKANEISWGCIQALIDSGEVNGARTKKR